MEIISFLAKHSYLLVILFAVLGPLIVRFLRKELGDGSPMPPFGGPQHRPGRAEAARPVTSQPVKPPREEARRPMSIAVREPETNIEEKRSNKGTASYKVNAERETINHRDVINGVIWSEILSPPRAKRPYRR